MKIVFNKKLDCFFKIEKHKKPQLDNADCFCFLGTFKPQPISKLVGHDPTTLLKSTKFTGLKVRESRKPKSENYCFLFSFLEIFLLHCTKMKKNLGATCYMNSTLQMLFMNHAFRQGLYSWKTQDVTFYISYNFSKTNLLNLPIH